MNEWECREFIKSIIVETIKRMEALSEKKVTCQEKIHFQTVVLVSGIIPFYEKAIETLNREYGTDIVYIVSDSQSSIDVKNQFRMNELSKNEMLLFCENAMRVVLLAPSLRLLSKIAHNDDSNMIEYMFLHSVLWNKEVSVYLDFQLDAMRKKMNSDQIQEIIKWLQMKNVSVCCYCKRKADFHICPQLEKKIESLITEADVKELFQAGGSQILYSADFLITPLARDKAKELGIVLQKVEE